jgi:hypothetical protein
VSSADPESRQWIDRLAIADLIYRFSDAATRADWDQIEAVFAPDALWESPLLGARFDGARTFREMLEGTDGSELLIQTAHQPVIRLRGSAEAGATTTIHEVIRIVAPTTTTMGEEGTVISYEQYGIYYDDFAKLDGEWKFTHRLFVPLHRAPGVETGEVIATRSSLLRPGAG